MVSALPAIAQTPLPAEVEAALQRARLPADSLAVMVAPAEGGAPLIRWRADQPVNAASVMKLVTTYAALDLLGPTFRWNTPVTFGGPVDTDGTLQGDLYIRGQGDPSLVLERLWLLLRRVQAMGVKNIAGDIVLDRSAFVLPPHDPGAFDGEPTKPYNAAPDALLVNFRALTLGFVPDLLTGRARVLVDPPLAGLRVPETVALAPARTACGDWRGGLQAELSDPERISFAGNFPAECGEKSWPVAYADPDHYGARAIQGLWRAMGGRLAGRAREGRAPVGSTPAFSAASPTLAEITRDINKYSNNIMAQQVFLTLSLQSTGTGSFEASREVVRRWWRERFADVDPPVLDNGAGLSRDGRISALGLTRLLQSAWRSPLMPDLAASLPMAGVDGTLRRSQAGAGSAHLKTGSLRDVAAVAGYVHTASGRRYVLVAIANHPEAGAARAAFDALVAWSARQ
ncbi:D-alanyl-D-alanine carboxypeptidase/D-alanyl-D-alanine-endopeptidase [Xylophilus sp. GOD-11R]|nr:D-alanyl-D-alanine carboxypeptidase/D-alanyl-D-alanine-endopeptidase [Xylophilus sp. GOD-11R]WPB59536.1 D-alanyl-D-alanine carboxypeptidase/D-alanyl-D-alanine-endopeptidase [Xylophilus sp. GOD-11R]